MLHKASVFYKIRELALTNSEKISIDAVKFTQHSCMHVLNIVSIQKSFFLGLVKIVFT